MRNPFTIILLRRGDFLFHHFHTLYNHLVVNRLQNGRFLHTFPHFFPFAIYGLLLAFYGFWI
jgi:hypothetical protein